MISVVGWIVAFVMILVSFFWIGGLAALVAPEEGPVAEATSVPPQDDEPADDEAVADDIVVLETAVGRYESDPGSWWYVAVIDNPNEDYIFDYASIDVEAIAADGTIIDVANEYRVILSGRTALVGDFIGVGDDCPAFSYQLLSVARDPSGRIIGGAWTYVDELPSTGADVPFEAVFWDPLPEGTVFEAYAAL